MLEQNKLIDAISWNADFEEEVEKIASQKFLRLVLSSDVNPLNP